MFAEDSAFFAETDPEATDIISSIAKIAESHGLTINGDKAKIMTTDGSEAKVDLEGVQLEQVREFKYLVSLLEDKKIAATAEVNSRIGKDSTAFISLKWSVWKKNSISLTTKMRLLRTLVLPILLYGSETWTLLKLDSNKLETFQMRCLRQILGISILSRIRNEHIRDSCGHQPTVEEQIRIRRLRWFGHVCRMDTTRPPRNLMWRKRPTQWKVQRAAPEKTWIKHIEADLKILWCSKSSRMEACR
ncbi:hypothetical protein Y032_0152g2888 [Ancylostoma ceylanicum]|uniref:Reverse transcriptase domain-containing protein n=1 Tax=Ancylostoma ceylanicum TaxID=53326 RepID=A0A016T0J9_9BILA|nr:hypothetical protein Y032_0152g2888 [Ancylostoma ceylanicum]